jgi:opacity protein-like surface antigen
MKKNIAFILLLFCFAPAIQAQDAEEQGPWAPLHLFIKNYYSKPDFVNNNTYLEFSGGLSTINANKVDIGDNFQATYLAEFRYGFIRYNEELPARGIFSHAKDYAFISTISSTFKVLDIQPSGLVTDTWRFGLGIENGYGYYGPFGNPFILFKHNGSITWTHIDFYDLGSAGNNQNYMRRFDDKFRFGATWSGGVDVHITKNILLSADYETNVIYPYFKPLQWTGMFIFDNATQRWIDYFEPQALRMFGKTWPVVKFAYKNFISYVVYNMRKNECYWPFESDRPISFLIYRAGITLSL